MGETFRTVRAARSSARRAASRMSVSWRYWTRVTRLYGYADVTASLPAGQVDISMWVDAATPDAAHEHALALIQQAIAVVGGRPPALDRRSMLIEQTA